jgi:hypothetical protein
MLKMAENAGRKLIIIKKIISWLKMMKMAENAGR